MALLAAMEEGERLQVLEEVAPRLSKFAKLTVEELEKACALTRERGVSIIQDTVNLGVSAEGRAFGDSVGRPMGSLSVAALSHRMPSQRVERISELLKDACADIERRLLEKVRNGWETGG